MSTEDQTGGTGWGEPVPGSATTQPQTPEEVLSTPPPGRDLESVLAERPSRNGRATSTTVLLAIVLLAVGFLGGLFVGRQTAPSNQAVAGPGNFPGGFPTPSGSAIPGGGGGGTFGTVTRVEGDTLYVKTANGQTVKVVVGSDTTIRVSQEGSLSDISKGSTVSVRGTTSNGTLNASSITEGDFGMGGFGGPGAGGAPGASSSG
jgi:hypothetical protein